MNKQLPTWKYDSSYVDGLLTITNSITGDWTRVGCLVDDIEETIQTIIEEMENDDSTRRIYEVRRI